MIYVGCDLINGCRSQHWTLLVGLCQTRFPEIDFRVYQSELQLVILRSELTMLQLVVIFADFTNRHFVVVMFYYDEEPQLFG